MKKEEMPGKKAVGKRKAQIGVWEATELLRAQGAGGKPWFHLPPLPVRCFSFIPVINTGLLSNFTFKRVETIKHMKNIFCRV